MCVQYAMRDFPLSGGYSAPKGSLIMPSIVAANMQVLACCICLQLQTSQCERSRGCERARSSACLAVG